MNCDKKTNSSNSDRQKVLIVDDESGIVELLKLLLEDHYTVFQAFSGKEALEKIDMFEPALVLLDYMMPDMTGLQVLKIIKEKHKNSFVVMVTGKGSEKLAVEIMKAGASDYIIKPFRNEHLLEVVRNVLLIRDITLKNWKLNDELYKANVRLQETAKSLESSNLNLEKRLTELARLQKLSSNINHVIELETLLDELLESIKDHFGFNQSFIALFDHDDSCNPHSVAFLGGLTTYVSDIEQLLQYKPVQQALTSLDVTIIPSFSDSLVSKPIVESSFSAIALPLVTYGRLIGIYYGESDRESGLLVENKDAYITISNQLATAIQNAQLFEQLSKSYLDTTFVLATAIEAKDQTMKGHIERVTRNAIQIGSVLGLSDEDIRTLQFGATLHDIGNLGIQDEVLFKQSSLNNRELEIVKRHPIIGEELISNIDFLKPVRPIVRHHHERWDGKGYPDNLMGEDIPLLARIISIVDVFDVLTHDQPYKKALSRQDAIQELEDNSGTQFDPFLLKTFLENLGNLPEFLENNQP